MAWMLYDKPGSREFGDIDFFVDKNKIRESLKVLSDNGFEPDHYRSYLLSKTAVAVQYLNTDYQLPLSPVHENIYNHLKFSGIAVIRVIAMTLHGKKLQTK